MRPLMLVQAPVATRSGYGSHSRDIIHQCMGARPGGSRMKAIRLRRQGRGNETQGRRDAEAQRKRGRKRQRSNDE